MGCAGPVSRPRLRDPGAGRRCRPPRAGHARISQAVPTAEGARAVPAAHPGRAFQPAPASVSWNSCRVRPLPRTYLTAAAAADWAFASADCGEAEPLSAACIAVHSGCEIFGYFVPRLSLVRPLAAATASTQDFRSGDSWACLDWIAWVAPM